MLNILLNKDGVNGVFVFCKINCAQNSSSHGLIKGLMRSLVIFCNVTPSESFYL